MATDQLRAAFDAIRTRLQAELDTHLAAIEARHGEALAEARRTWDAEAEQHTAARLEAHRQEWTSKLEAQLAAAAAESQRTLAEATARARLEAEQSAAERLAAARQEHERLMAAALQAARQEHERTLAQALASAQQEHERAASEAVAAARREAEAALNTAREQSSTLDAERHRSALELQAARDEHAREISAERGKLETLNAEYQRLQKSIDAERGQWARDLAAAKAERDAAAQAHQHAQAAFAAERDRQTQALEEERRRAASVEEARARAEAALEEERTQSQGRLRLLEDGQAARVTEARAAERQSQLAAMERLLSAVRDISLAKSLTDVLGALVSSAGAEAPRAAIFIVSGRTLQAWRSSGFADGASPPHLSLADAGILAEAVQAGSVVSTSGATAPDFAALSSDRAGLAVPITVGGQAVAVLYADDGGVETTEVPAAWPEAIQILGRHASVCLSHLTAVRTAQAIRSAPAAVHAPRPASAASPDEENSARRYARLLVSEIKLYNEAAVRLGRERRDILIRLRPEIDRARRLYEERVPASIGSRGVYFQQELVHTLAGGDPGLLGGSA